MTWQKALAVWLLTSISMGVVLGVGGWREGWRPSRDDWRWMAGLGACAFVGVAVVMDLRAGMPLWVLGVAALLALRLMRPTR